jgi:hypothetical protein
MIDGDGNNEESAIKVQVPEMESVTLARDHCDAF